MLRATRAFTLLLVTLCAASAAAAPRRSRRVVDRRPLYQRGRHIEANHPFRRQVSSEALLGHVLSVMGGADIATLPRHVRKALSKKMRKPVRRLRTKKGQLHALSLLRGELGDTRFEHIVGGNAFGLKVASQLLDAHGYDRRGEDKRDMARGWGFRLLPKNDKAFNDPHYLARVLRDSGQTGAGHFIENDPAQADQLFERAWAAVAPKNTRPMSYTLTGSDANNLMLGVAKVVAERNAGRDVQAGTILTFADNYVAGRGLLANQSFVVGAGRRSPNIIDSPHTNTFHPVGEEAKRVAAIETRALGQIRDKVKAMRDSNAPVGGLMLEPIIGAKGAYVYRPSFMTKLRALCDELHIPIIADEILTGGGRTGKFFAYEHYKGFEPDFITFGKGLQVAGVAQVSRKAGYFSPPRNMVTQKGSSAALLKGAQVLTRIKQDNLIENAAKVGKYFLAKLKEIDPPQPGSYGNPAPEGARGVGLLLYSRTDYALGVRGAMGRLMPYLTISKADVDALFAEMKRKQKKPHGW